jgi:predicted RNA binding protein YcfA (HicA-like mRNA interferase family)
LSFAAISKSRFIRALGRLGFVCARQKGSHQKWQHADGRWLYVYFHAREDLRPATIRKILADARIPEEDFLKALR